MKEKNEQYFAKIKKERQYYAIFVLPKEVQYNQIEKLDHSCETDILTNKSQNEKKSKRKDLFHD